MILNIDCKDAEIQSALQYVDSIETQMTRFLDSDSNHRLHPQVVADGKIYRYPLAGKGKQNLDCWFVCFEHGGVKGCYSLDETSYLKPKYNREPTALERIEIEREREETERKLQEALKEQYEQVSKKCQKEWNGFPEATDEHPYLQRKQVKNHGLKLDKDSLVIPLYLEGKLWSLERILIDGTKILAKGGRKAGCYFIVGNGEPEFMAEGYATCASINEATGKTVAMAIDAGNLPKVAKTFPHATIVADNDQSGTGEKYAQKASKLYGNLVKLIPEEGLDANDYACKYGLQKLKDFLEPSERGIGVVRGRNLLTMGKPVDYLIKHWIPKGCKIVQIFGASGCGKTFIVLDMCLHMAFALPLWHGYKGRSGKIFYSSAEGNDTINARTALWVQKYFPRMSYREAQSILDNSFCRPLAPMRIDKPEELQMLIDTIDTQCPFIPDVIVFDTQAYHMAGEENSNDDGQAFIKACYELGKRYNAVIIPVHHTGWNKESQSHGRGSSSVYGGLDRCYKVSALGSGLTLIDQVKNKDEEEIHETYFQREIHHLKPWIDDDGSIIESFVDIDGEVLTSCVMVPTVNTANDADDKLQELKTQAEKYIKDFGFQDDNGDLIISHDDLKKARKLYYKERMAPSDYEKNASTRVSQDVSTTDKAKQKGENFVMRLINAKFWEYIQKSKPTPVAWRVLDEGVKSRWQMPEKQPELTEKT